MPVHESYGPMGYNPLNKIVADFLATGANPLGPDFCFSKRHLLKTHVVTSMNKIQKPWEPTFPSFLGGFQPIFLGILKPSLIHGHLGSNRILDFSDASMHKNKKCDRNICCDPLIP